MKSDLTTSVVVFIVGIVMAYFAGGMVFSAPSSVSIETIKTDTNYDAPDPDPEIFNFRAINPTVEAWIGECTNRDSEGNCLDNQTENQEEENTEEPNEESEPENEAPEEENTNQNDQENPEVKNSEGNSEGGENGETD